MILLLLAIAGAADCPGPVASPALEGTVAEAEAAYLELDEDRFLVATDRLLVTTPCLDEPLEPELAARVHRTLALRLFGTRRDDALAAIAAARRAAPSLGMGGLVGDAHPLAQTWATPLSGAGRRLPAAREGSLWLDGSARRQRFDGEAVLFQRVDAGEALTTALLFPADPVPSYPRVPPARRPLQIAAAGSALAAIGAFALASASAASFDRPGQSADALQATQTRTNGLVVASGVLGAAAIGTGAASLAVR